MVKKAPPKKKTEEDIHIKVESWQWESSSPKKLTGKHWLAITILLAFALLLAFGFLFIAGIVLILGIIFNLILYLFKKIS